MKVLIVSLAVMGFAAGCASSVDSSPVDETPGANEQAASASSCRCKPMHCPKDALCKFACQPIGNCGTTCNVLMLCAEGYTFDDKACRCLPSNGGVKCGNGACGAGQVCCNDSCGICTAPGEGCIQLYCGPAI